MNKRIFLFILIFGTLSVSAPAKAEIIGTIVYAIVDEFAQRAVRGLGSSKTPDDLRKEIEAQRLSRERAEIQDFTSYVLRKHTEEQKNELYSVVYERVEQVYSRFPEGQSRMHELDLIETGYAIQPKKSASLSAAN